MSGGLQLSLSVAFVGFIFLFFLAFSIYLTWNGFFHSFGLKASPGQESQTSSPEWRALVDRRQEIENDPMLDEQSKKILIENWQAMALESRPHMSESGSASIQYSVYALPLGVPGLVGGVLAIAILFTYVVGAMHPGALTWPEIGGQARDGLTAEQAVAAAAGHPGDGASLVDRLAGLKERLAQQPDDLRGWVLLARTHASMSNFTESANALKKALELTPGHPDILADLADMTAMVQDRRLAGEPEQYIAAALQSDPRHEKALALAASAAEQAGDEGKAQVYWQLLSQVQQANLKGPAPQAQSPSNRLTTVRVNVPSAALNQMNADSALFVFLKAQPGPGKPLAVVRVPATQLKAGEQAIDISANDFLDEAGLNQLPATLHAQARLSIQGMAQTTVGDIQSVSVAVDTSRLAEGIRLNLPEGLYKP